MISISAPTVNEAGNLVDYLYFVIIFIAPGYYWLPMPADRLDVLELAHFLIYMNRLAC